MYNTKKKFIPAEAAEVLVAIKGGVDFKSAGVYGFHTNSLSSGSITK